MIPNFWGLKQVCSLVILTSKIQKIDFTQIFKTEKLFTFCIMGPFTYYVTQKNDFFYATNDATQ